jgi:hypothetical protein
MEEPCTTELLGMTQPQVPCEACPVAVAVEAAGEQLLTRERPAAGGEPGRRAKDRFGDALLGEERDVRREPRPARARNSLLARQQLADRAIGE